jgi:hypothetical protein
MLNNKNNLRISWTDTRKLCLVKVVQQYGGHLCDRSATKKVWKDINLNFFKQDEMKDYASMYDPEKFRKIKEKYDSIIDEVTKMMMNGNLSKFDGELSELFDCCKVMIEETEVANEERTSKKLKDEADKKAINENEIFVMEGPDARKRKEIENSKTIIKVDKRPKENTFEDKLISMVDSTLSKNKEKLVEVCVEDNIEETMQQYVKV